MGSGIQRAALTLVLIGCGRSQLAVFGGEDRGDDLRVDDDDAPDDAFEDAAGDPTEQWLLSIDTNGYALLRIDVRDAATSVICELQDDGSRYTSATLHHDGRLFVTYKVDSAMTAPDRFARLDPCTCERTVIAEYDWGAASGLVWSDSGLFVVSHAADELRAIEPRTGTMTTIGPLGVDVHNNGASWFAGAMYLLEGDRDALYRVDVQTARAELVTELGFDFATIGFEIHPDSGRMYACTNDAVLYEVDPGTGSVAAIGRIQQDGNCGNLAAARGPVRCVP